MSGFRLRPLLLSLSCAALPGCITFHTLPEDVSKRIDEAAAPLQPHVDDDAAVRRIGEAATRGELPAIEDCTLPPAPGCDDYVRLALLRNPRVQARVRDLQALGFAVPQAAALGDPMLDFVPPTPGMLQTAAGQMQWGLGVTQSIPWPGKLAAGGVVAEHEVRVALESLEAERQAVIAEVKRAYADLFGAHATLQASRDMEPLLRRLRADAESRVAAGRADWTALQRIDDELDTVTDSCISLELELRTATARLDVLMDRPIDAPLPEPTGLEIEALRDDPAALVARALAHNPQLAAMRRMIARDLATIDLAEQQYHPDFSVGGMFNAIMDGISPVANGKDAWNLSLGVSLPLNFDRLRAGVLQRNAATLASVLRYRSERNAVLLALQELTARADAGHRRAVLLRDEILPRTRRNLEAVRAQYEAGRADFAALVELSRRVLELTLEERRARAALTGDLAEIERLTGGASETEEVKS
ncbi:MAG: TolC family protein [Planctomycetota bacterium]